MVDVLPIDDHESGDILRRREILVASSHDESDNALEENANRKRVARAHPITYKGTGERTRDVECIDHNAQANRPPQGGIIAQDNGDPFGGVNAE